MFAQGLASVSHHHLPASNSDATGNSTEKPAAFMEKPAKKPAAVMEKPAEKKAAVVMENACASTGWVDTALLSNLRGSFLINQKTKVRLHGSEEKAPQKNSWLYLTGTPVRHQEFIAH